MAQYAEVMTRGRMEGCVDKLALLQQLARERVRDREFHELVLAKVAGAGNSAEAQASRWCSYVESLEYRRDPVWAEVFRDPLVTMRVGGGDCDDLTLLCLAGLECLAIPCQPEALCDEEGWAFHVRVLVGLPPMAPRVWAVVDPVWQSERQWAMAGVPSSSLPVGQDMLLSSTPSSSTGSLATTAAVAAAGLMLGRWGMSGLAKLLT